MAKNRTTPAAGFTPIAVARPDETVRPAFKPVAVVTVTEPAPAVHILPAPEPDPKTEKPASAGKKEA